MVEVVPILPPGSSYHYMGVLVNLHLNWDSHLAHVQKKVTAYQHMIHHQALTMDDKVYVSNMVANAFVSYSMCVVPYPRV